MGRRGGRIGPKQTVSSANAASLSGIWDLYTVLQEVGSSNWSRFPLAPTSLSAIPTFNSAAISFTQPADFGTISNYEYALSTNGGASFSAYTALSPTDSTSPITVSGLTATTSYQVKIRAVNQYGIGAESNALAFTTSAATISGVEYLVIAGGGGGGRGGRGGGGGGAGGYRSSVVGQSSGQNSSAEATLTINAGTTYTVTVGGGGGSQGQGSDSVFSTITSSGGGTGGSYNGAGAAGGSGGGSSNSGGGGAGTANQGFAGANNSNNQNVGAGGGGAGQAGQSSPGADEYRGGNGGAGIASNITGTSITRAGGGGGGSGYSGGNATGSGGSGIGGSGGTVNGGAGSAGTANTGSGGGGGGMVDGGGNGAGGNGGSGIVIVRYPTASASGFTITGGTITTSGSYTIHTFTSSGSLVVA